MPKAKRKVEKTLKMQDIIRSEFQMAILNLMNSSNLSVKSSYELIKVFRAVADLQKDYEELRSKLLEKHGQKDQGGNLMMNEDKTQYLLNDKSSFDKEFRDLLNLEISLPKISLSYIEEAKLSPAMLMVLVDSIVTP